MNLVFFIITLFFSSFGIIYLLSKIKYLFFKTKDNQTLPPSLIFIPISGHIENMELLARKYKNAYKLNPIFKNVEVFFVDYGLDKETIKICQKLENENNLKLCTQVQIYTIVREMFNKKNI